MYIFAPTIRPPNNRKNKLKKKKRQRNAISTHTRVAAPVTKILGANYLLDDVLYNLLGILSVI
jgi:hypothetical protein